MRKSTIIEQDSLYEDQHLKQFLNRQQKSTKNAKSLSILRPKLPSTIPQPYNRATYFKPQFSIKKFNKSLASAKLQNKQMLTLKNESNLQKKLKLVCDLDKRFQKILIKGITKKRQDFLIKKKGLSLHSLRSKSQLRKQQQFTNKYFVRNPFQQKVYESEFLPSQI